jgi:hypothetical protein
MARFLGNATGRTLAETVKTGTRHLSDKEMPKALVTTRGKRFSPRPPGKPDSQPVAAEAPPADDAQD